MKDNPALLERDPGYLRRLRQISNRGLRLAMEKGDWDAIDEVLGALWQMADLEGGRVGWQRRNKAATVRRVVAVDPSDGISERQSPGQARRQGDAFGVCVCAKGLDGVGYVEDSREWRDSPRRMAEQTIELYKDVRADAIVVERNHGGAWLIEVFRGVNPYVNIVTTWASEGKITRAEPVAALFVFDADAELPYRARLVGDHEQLEEEMTSYTGEPGQQSPNQLDAVVWAMNDLMLGGTIDTDGKQRDTRGRGRR
jgi:phage terminase large subunit-like protein